MSNSRVKYVNNEESKSEEKGIIVSVYPLENSKGAVVGKLLFQRDKHTPMFIAALFKIAKTWK